MRKISEAERKQALQDGMFEGRSLDDGIYTPKRLERLSEDKFLLVFEERGDEFSVEVELTVEMGKNVQHSHREYRLSRLLEEPFRNVIS